MKDYKFLKKKEQGDVGASFFIRRHNELLVSPVVLMKDMSDWDIEGSDVTAIRQIWVPPSYEGDLVGEKTTLYPCLEYGGVEIKTLSYDQFLPRFGVNDLSCGTLGFPVWGKTKDLINDWTTYTRDEFGNLYRWMNPSVQNHAAQPMSIVHLLETVDFDNETGQEKNRFFAAIAFEDIPALFARLNKYLKPFGLNISTWDNIPTGENARNLRIDDLFLQGNMVHVPLAELAGLMTVTMIGDDPVIYETGRCSAAIQAARLAYLKILANGRWIPQERTDSYGQNDEDLFRLWERMHPIGSLQGFVFMNKNGSQMSP